MEAARQIDGESLSYVDAALAALNAGCDLALLCNQSIGDGAVLDELLDGFSTAAREGQWKPDPASEARRRGLLPKSPAIGWDDLMQSSAYRGAVRMLPKP